MDKSLDDTIPMRADRLLSILMMLQVHGRLIFSPMAMYTNPFIQAAHHRASRSGWAGQGMEDLRFGPFMGHVRSEYVAYARLTSDNHYIPGIISRRGEPSTRPRHCYELQT